MSNLTVQDIVLLRIPEVRAEYDKARAWGYAQEQAMRFARSLYERDAIAHMAICREARKADACDN